jgi:uncharacterized protein
MSLLSPELAAKRDRLLSLLGGYGSCAVAFSGGLDSAVLAKAARLALGQRAVAVTGASESMAAGEREQAAAIARLIGIRHEVVSTGEMSIEAYCENSPQRCYHCKQELFARLAEVARRLDLAVLADGSNQDDLGDYRPGRRALAELNVQSPLAECGLTKAELRELAADWHLPVADKPATPCLASRVAYGERITPQRLRMIDRAEEYLRQNGFSPPLRVRYHAGDVARIEVAVTDMEKLFNERFRRELVEQFKNLGFKFIALDLEGFRSGAMNRQIGMGE